MDDAFLYGLRQPPSPEFAASLKQRLRAERLKSALSSQALKLAACVAAVIVAASIVAGRSGLESARFDKFASVGEEVRNIVRAIYDLPQDFSRRIDFVMGGKPSTSASGNAVPVQTEPLITTPMPQNDRPCGPPGQTVRPVVGKPLVDASQLRKSGRNVEALARARDAERVPNKTPFEACLVGQVLMSLEANLGMLPKRR